MRGAKIVLKNIMKKPKILLFDIETMANLVYTWGKYEQDVIAYKRHWYMLSFAYKWLGENKTYVCSLPDYSIYKKDKFNDYFLTKELWNLFNEADIVIAHNGQAFDVKKVTSRFLKHGFPPPSPYKQVDTKLVAKKYLKQDSNKLDDLGDYFGIGRKLTHEGFNLWLGCEAGDKASWKKMCQYNKQDVMLLEKVYNKLLPYITNHPNLAIYTGNNQSCPNCASSDIIKDGKSYRSSGIWQKWKCKSCTSWHSSPLKDNALIR